MQPRVENLLVFIAFVFLYFQNHQMRILYCFNMWYQYFDTSDYLIDKLCDITVVCENMDAFNPV